VNRLGRIKAKEVNDLITKINELTKYSRGIGSVKTNPGIFINSGMGVSTKCHRYGDKAHTPIPEDMRQQKYQGGDVSNAKVQAGKRVMADGMNGIVDGINKAITEIRINVTGNDAPGLDVQGPSHVTKNTIARLQQLQACINAVNTIDNTLHRVDGWFNSNNRCNRSCQVNCQVGCQVACNSVNWCHDQKCGGH
jgi:hypothetical protein